MRYSNAHADIERSGIDNGWRWRRTHSISDRAVKGEMKAQEIQLRKATIEDAKVIWRLANDPLVRSMSFISRPIPWEEHIVWYEGQLNSKTALFYILENAQHEFLGNVRFALEAGTARISIALAEGARGGGAGARSIKASCASAFEEPGIERVEAYIRPSNPASAKAFKNAGFTLKEETQAYGENAWLFELLRPN